MEGGPKIPPILNRIKTKYIVPHPNRLAISDYHLWYFFINSTPRNQPIIVLCKHNIYQLYQVSQQSSSSSLLRLSSLFFSELIYWQWSQWCAFWWCAHCQQTLSEERWFEQMYKGEEVVYEDSKGLDIPQAG